MKEERLVRALERGGCAILRPDLGWDVRRTSDARSTVIGKLSPSVVEALCGSGCLKRIGDYEPARLVWSEVKITPATPRPFTAQTVDAAEQKSSRGSLLQHCMQATACPKVRQYLARAAEQYLEDIHIATQAGAISGMNWQELSLGTRINTSKTADRRSSGLYASQASRRLQCIYARFGAGCLRELNAVIVSEVSRNRFSETFGVPRRKVEARTLAHLSKLADLYTNAVSAPERL